MSGYLDLVGNRLLDGFDISEPSALELPDVLLRAIRTAVEAGARGRRMSRRRSPRSAPRCPRSTRRSSTSCSARRGCSTGSATSAASTATSGPRGSCAGRRSPPAGGSPRAGASHDPAHFVDAGFDEMCALVSGSGGPSADELAARAEYRATHSAKDAPATLGPPPPAAARPVRRCRRPWRGSCAPPGSRSARCSAAPRRSTRSTCCAASPRAAASTRARPACVSGPAEFDRIVQGDVLVTDVDDRGVQHPAAAARRDRHRQRRPALPLGDRRARVRHPRRRRDARGDGAHRGRRARARRRRRRRGDRPRVSDVVSLAEVARHLGLRLEGRRARGGAPRRPPRSARRRARRGRSSRRSPADDEDAIEQVAEAVAPARRPARGPLVGGRRGRRRRELRRTAPDAAQRAVGGRAAARRCARSGGRRTPTRRSPTASASGSSPGRASPSSSRCCSTRRRAGVMFTQNPVTGADERMIEASWGLGEAVVAGLVIPDSFRIDRDGEVLERRAGPEADRDPRPAGRRHRRGGGPARADRAALPRRRAARGAERARAAAASRSTARAATSSGRSRTARSTCCSAGP